ncbi:MAG: UDP-N-acetylmuramoyl-tripeptide--D-alanyl-D-alanine ligase [Gemmatimonadetes bacterium]|nr:UDP-N-acetylmuramoyl-tripeptide--D-alanyl-D-alanine ligase [Gemmatimonadota bacterium]
MTHGFWTLARVADALGGGPRDDRAIGGISTDTRTVAAGDLFVALAGERFNAHDFLAQAVAQGAVAVVVHDARRAAGLGVPVYDVENTLHALGALARYRRRAWGRPVIAIGGSNGKTSTKELVRAALGARLTVHATSGNLNNQVGVPLTLLALPDDADVAVIEVGTNMPGEIALLRDIVEPDLALVTTVQEEHLEGFGDLAGVLREEASLFDGVAAAIVPADEAALVAEARQRARRVVTAGLGAGDVMAVAYGLHADGSGWLDLEAAHVDVPLKGEHNLRNAMLAIAAARECGLFDDETAAAIASLDVAAMPGMRSAVSPLGAALLVHDAYNANPGSARAALALLAKVGAGRQRVAVLGTMRELGAAAERAHLEIARAALDSGADVVAGIGEFAPALTALAAGDARVVTASDVDDLWPLLAPRLAADAAILLKASRGVKLERLVPLLTAWATQPV